MRMPLSLRHSTVNHNEGKTWQKLALLGACAGLVVFLSACHHTAVPVAPPPPLQNTTDNNGAGTGDKPTLNFFDVEPGVLASGQSAVLRWSVANASSVEIDNGVGQVKSDGRLEVHPEQTATYSLKATNQSGSLVASATVTVTQAPAPAADAGASRESRVEIAGSELQEIHFDYNSDDIPSSERPVLDKDVSVLKELFGLDPSLVITIEGHCDERGSAEFNMGLGDQRARMVKQALVNAGIPAAKLETVSFGKERPLCLEATEECYARNRRAHFSIPR